MHQIEPYYSWQDYYLTQEDELSPFYQKEYSEFYFSERIYNHLIHPQWDNFGSDTLFMKILFADYDQGFTIIELLGEWNDCLQNDIMFLKRDIAEHMMLQGINKFIFIGENVLNFHYSEEDYYDEWFEEVNDKDGWIALLNFREHVLDEFQEAQIDQYFVLGGKLNEITWRTFPPRELFQHVETFVQRRIGI